MADFGIEDLWYLKPGGGQDPTVGSQWLQGMKFGADQRQTTIENMFKERQIEDQTKRTMIAAQTALAKMQTDQQRDRGMAEISAYLSTVAENNAWNDPKAEAGYFKLLSAYPQAITEGEGLAVHKNTFQAAKAMTERAREVDQHEERLRQAEEDRANNRMQELKIRQQRADIYGQSKTDTKEWHDAQQALKEAEAETDSRIKNRKLDVAERLATVAEQKADTNDMLAKARVTMWESKARDLERGLPRGMTAIFRAQFETLRDRYQFPTSPKDKLSTEEYNTQLEALIKKYETQATAPGGPAPVAPGTPAAPPARAPFSLEDFNNWKQGK